MECTYQWLAFWHGVMAAFAFSGVALGILLRQAGGDGE